MVRCVWLPALVPHIGPNSTRTRLPHNQSRSPAGLAAVVASERLRGKPRHVIATEPVPVCGEWYVASISLPGDSTRSSILNKAVLPASLFVCSMPCNSQFTICVDFFDQRH